MRLANGMTSTAVICSAQLARSRLADALYCLNIFAIALFTIINIAKSNIYHQKAGKKRETLFIRNRIQELSKIITKTRFMAPLSH